MHKAADKDTVGNEDADEKKFDEKQEFGEEIEARWVEQEHTASNERKEACPDEKVVAVHALTFERMHLPAQPRKSIFVRESGHAEYKPK